MIIVGITGKYCAGKNTAAELLSDAGYREIDVDTLGHEALRRERGRIINRFGADLAVGDDEVDRQRLGQIVFADKAALKDLESIVHPAMVTMVTDQIAGFRGLRPMPVGVAVNAAVLFRMDLSRLCDLILYIHAPFRVRYQRARQRDNASLLSVVRRLASQRDVAPQYSAPNADIHSVQNDGSREQLRSRLETLLPLP